MKTNTTRLEKHEERVSETRIVARPKTDAEGAVRSTARAATEAAAITIDAPDVDQMLSSLSNAVEGAHALREHLDALYGEVSGDSGDATESYALAQQAAYALLLDLKDIAGQIGRRVKVGLLDGPAGP